MIDNRVLVKIAKRRGFLEARINELEKKLAAVQAEIDVFKAERRTLTNEALAAAHGVASSSIDRYLRAALEGAGGAGKRAAARRVAPKKVGTRKAAAKARTKRK